MGGCFTKNRHVVFFWKQPGKGACVVLLEWRLVKTRNVWKVYKEHIYFETSHAQPWGKQQLECAIQVLGADHIIFGSSYPVRREWLLEGAEFIKMLDISNEEKDMILYKNACQIYHIDE